MKRMVESEIADILNEKLQVDGDEIVVNGSVKAKTLEQTEPNLNITTELTLPEHIEIAEGYVPYTAIKVINGVLWLVAVMRIKNTGATTFSGALTLFPGIRLPSKVSSKIYRMDGSKCDAAYTSVAAICDSPLMIGTSHFRAVVGSYGANELNLYIALFSLAAGATADISCRIPIVLIP